ISGQGRLVGLGAAEGFQIAHAEAEGEVVRRVCAVVPWPWQQHSNGGDSLGQSVRHVSSVFDPGVVPVSDDPDLPGASQLAGVLGAPPLASATRWAGRSPLAWA
ncbi:MAG UNVERIFIED_CONTAM: hypothetical protein LOD86_12920, partial [Thermobifida fusca]